MEEEEEEARERKREKKAGGEAAAGKKARDLIKYSPVYTSPPLRSVQPGIKNGLYILIYPTCHV